MRLPGLLAAAILFAPSLARAEPLDLAPRALVRHADTTTSTAPDETTPDTGSEPDDSMYEPTSSKAPDSAETVDLPEPPPQAEPEAPVDSSATLSEERTKAKPRPRDRPFNRHGIGVRGGIVVIPSWILSRYVATHTNSLCRGGSIGNFAAKRGLLKTQGCNFYLGGQYVYRQSRILDIVGSIGYQSIKAPDGYWLDNSKWNPGCKTNANGVDPTIQKNCDLSAADYTQVNLNMMSFEADFIARAPLVVTEDVEFGLGGGGGIGLGVLFGGVYQTKIGSPAAGYTPAGGATPSSCQQLTDLADFTKCTPHWDPTQKGAPATLPPLSNPNPGNFATCSKDKCNESDLKAFGYHHKQSSIPPVIPIVNLIISARIIIKDTFGITINGGWNTGFYFGGAMTYFFGKQFQKGGSGPNGSR